MAVFVVIRISIEAFQKIVCKDTVAVAPLPALLGKLPVIRSADNGNAVADLRQVLQARADRIDLYALLPLLAISKDCPTPPEWHASAITTTFFALMKRLRAVSMSHMGNPVDAISE